MCLHQSSRKQSTSTMQLLTTSSGSNATIVACNVNGDATATVWTAANAHMTVSVTLVEIVCTICTETY